MDLLKFKWRYRSEALFYIPFIPFYSELQSESQLIKLSILNPSFNKLTLRVNVQMYKLATKPLEIKKTT